MKQTLGRIVLSCLAALLAQAHPVAGQPRRHAVDVTAVVVEVPVQVLAADGKPVRGLEAEDFELREGRRVQEITGFEVIDLVGDEPGDGTKAMPVPLPARRHFLLLFDLGFSEPGKIARARQAAREVVAHRLHPTDLVAVATYSGAVGARWILGFTSDRGEIDAAIEDLGVIRSSGQAADPLALTRLDPSATGEAVSDLGGRGRSVLTDTILQEHLEDLAADFDRTSRAELSGHAQAMLQGLQAIGEQLRWIHGRKHVLLFSQGFPSSLVLGLGSQDSARIREINEAAMQGEYWRVNSDERFGSSASLSVLESLVAELRRTGTALEAIDITGIAADPEDIMARPPGEDILFALADATGGELYRNFNDLGEAMTELLARTSITYVLSFQPRDPRADGSYHPIRVRLRDGPEGGRVLHRPGYHAPLPLAEQSPEVRQITAAQLLLGGEVGGPMPVAAVAAPQPGTGERAHVTLLLEIDGDAILGPEGRGGRTVLDLYAYAFDAAGEIRDFVARQVGLDLRLLEPKLRQRGLKFWSRLALPPGAYTTRVLVRDLATGRDTVQEVAFTVPDFATQRQPLLLPPLFVDGPPEWLVIGQPANGTETEESAGLALAGGPFLPAARASLRPGGEAELALLTWHADAASRQLEGRILGAAGELVATASLERLAVHGRPDGLERIEARLRGGDLPPGAYVLEVRLDDPAGGAPLTGSTRFEVASHEG